VFYIANAVNSECQHPLLNAMLWFSHAARVPLNGPMNRSDDPSVGMIKLLEYRAENVPALQEESA